jgi:6-pyruvoyltetrahydropterin/6-carboxytetrahydropterin synthase
LKKNATQSAARGKMSSITVKHNMEVAHRLLMTPGKCENIHGHSMWVELELFGNVDARGFVAGLDFSQVKKLLRAHMDENFDHRLLLNHEDPWTQYELPGLHTCVSDPTTENIASWLGEWASYEFKNTDVEGIQILVAETSCNFARWAKAL